MQQDNSPHLRVIVKFTNGLSRTFKTDLQPGVNEANQSMYIKNMGTNTGGTFIPIRSIVYVDVTPMNGFDADGLARQMQAARAQGGEA